MNILNYEFPAVELPSDDNGKYDGMPDPLADSHFTYIGKMPYKKSIDIKSSPIGVGYETLDRDTFDPEPTYQFMAYSGSKWARVQSGWNKTEKVDGVFDFAWLDEIVDNLIKIGITPWISLSYGNALHSPVAAYEKFKENNPPETWPQHIRGYVGEIPIYHGEHAIKAWERYVRAIVKHFAGRVKHWEVWNEPNTGKGKGCGFWRDHADVVYPDMEFVERLFKLSSDYVELVKITAKQVLSEDSNAIIIAGAITNGCNAPAYIDGMNKAGIANYADVISYHPYGYVPEFNLDARYNFIKNTIKTPKKEMRIWQGESGRTAGKASEGSSYIATEYNQAKYLCRRFVADVSLGSEVSSFFNVSDFANYHGEGEFQYGIFNRIEKRPKLAFDALCSMGYLFDGIETAPDLYVHLRTISFSSMMRYQLAVSQFRRKGVPLFSLYFPEHPDIPFEKGWVDLRFYVKETGTFSSPVIIDPIRRKCLQT